MREETLRKKYLPSILKGIFLTLLWGLVAKMYAATRFLYATEARDANGLRAACLVRGERYEPATEPIHPWA